MNVTNNNEAAEIANAFEFRARHYALTGKDDKHETATRVAAYRKAAADFEQARKWYMAAYAQTIGHGKRSRYEEAADRCAEQKDLNTTYAAALTTQCGNCKELDCTNDECAGAR